MQLENQSRPGPERLDERRAGVLRVHARRPASPPPPPQPFSPRLALERAFVAAPTD